MAKQASVSLDDKFDLNQERVLLTGTQAVVRLALMQRARDRAMGLDTAGYVTGYRGSPIATLETWFTRAKPLLEAEQIRFQPGLNEDLAATALWGAQQAELRGEGKYDGVFGIWYGKGPGVDRSGDVFRHANHAGTSRYGGVLALMGDDHNCESSTSAHQSEFAFVDAMMPVLNPAGVQEILDFGLIGLALSRYAGVWVGIKCVKDTIESTAGVDGRIDRVRTVTPIDFDMPEGGLNIRLHDTPLAKEARLHDLKRPAILAFARANGLDKLVFDGGPAARIGIVTTGKSYLDVRQALDQLGIDEARAGVLGLRLYKVGLVWPLEPDGLDRFAEGLDVIIAVEEKRSLIETQIKEQLYGCAGTPLVIGKRDEDERTLFPAKGALEPVAIALGLGERLVASTGDEALKARIDGLKRIAGNRIEGDEIITRIPYFCAGCPHNSSTRVPEGARAYAGIGCHYMAQWMDRATDGFTQMGGEGANWIGEAPFSRRGHVFQNIGDGTYIHSGILAIRAALAAGTNITFKLLYNDAVAMTGGQALDGGLTVPRLARQMLAEGVGRVAIVTDEPDKYGSGASIPHGVGVHDRRELGPVQEALAGEAGVTVLIYDQTCAAEKRRRRKRGLYPDPPKRVFINEAVCEGCGDCGLASNCVAIQPTETEWGRKRAIDQSACNKDFSCLDGFCPSFVTIHGGRLRKPESARLTNADLATLAALPEPDARPSLDGPPFSLLVTGVGGTGVVTVSAILGQAAHIDGLGVGAIDMTGLAQKGGAVACHLRFARDPKNIHAIRAGAGGADAIIGCDLVVTAAHKVLETVRPGHTRLAVNAHEMTTGEFTHDPDLEFPGPELRDAIETRAGEDRARFLDAHDLALRFFGDSIAANMIVTGFAWQLGLVPISAAAIEAAIGLNSVAVKMNRHAFAFGRLAAHDAPALARILDDGFSAADTQATAGDLDTLIERRVEALTGYQNAAYAERYRERVAAIRRIENERMPGSEPLTQTAAKALFRLMAYKDEYEIARLYVDGTFERALAATFEGDYRLEFHLAPALISPRDPATGHAKKRAFGPWVMRLFRLLARLKGLRGTRLDLFGYRSERRLERQLLMDYERLLDEIAARLSPANYDTALELAALPLSMRGYGHVKEENVRAAQAREAELLDLLRAPRTERSAHEAA